MASSFESLVDHDFQDRIAEAALADEDFLNEFLVRPKEAYLKRFQEEMFPGEVVEVEDEGNGITALKIPRLGKGMLLSRNLIIGSDELTEAELELVAGGAVCSVGGNGSGCVGSNVGGNSSDKTT